MKKISTALGLLASVLVSQNASATSIGIAFDGFFAYFPSDETNPSSIFGFADLFFDPEDGLTLSSLDAEAASLTLAIDYFTFALVEAPGEEELLPFDGEFGFILIGPTDPVSFSTALFTPGSLGSLDFFKDLTSTTDLPADPPEFPFPSLVFEEEISIPEFDALAASAKSFYDLESVENGVVVGGFFFGALLVETESVPDAGSTSLLLSLALAGLLGLRRTRTQFAAPASLIAFPAENQWFHGFGASPGC